MADLLASDADREFIADGLRTHHAAGRLTDDDLDERLGVALRARTRGELTRLVADLPAPPAAPPLHLAALDEATTVMIEHGWGVVEARPGQWTVLEREHRPWWVWLIVVLTFPLGLLALLIKNRERVTLRVGADGAVLRGGG